MVQRHGAPRVIAGEVAIFGKGVDQGRFRRRDQAVPERDPVQQRDDAFRDGADIVQGLGPEGDRAERPAPAFVRALEIGLQQDGFVAGDDDAVQVGHFRPGREGSQPCRHPMIEAGVFRPSVTPFPVHVRCLPLGYGQRS